MSENLFPLRLKEYREKLGLSQAELAEMAKVPPSSISNFESGNREPALKTLRRLCDVLKVTADSLLGRDVWEKDIEGRLGYLEFEIKRMKDKYFEPWQNIQRVKP